MTRPDWQDYFLALAKAVALRADCSRRQVGCVVVDSDNRVCSTGYNGSPPGGPSCLAGQCPRGKHYRVYEGPNGPDAFCCKCGNDWPCPISVDPGSSYDTGPGACVAVHAEANALLYADYHRLKGASVYITDEPCGGCRKLLDAMPLKAVYWPSGQLLRE